MEEVRTEEEILAGKHSVLEALRAGRTLNKIWVAETAQKHLTAPIIAEARKAGIVIQHVDKRKLDQLAPGVQHQGLWRRQHLLPIAKWKIYWLQPQPRVSLRF